MAPRGKGNKRGKRSGGKKRGGPRRKTFNMKEQASLTEVINTAGIQAANTNFSVYNLSLSDMPRARDIARGYQFYRIKRCTYVIKPTQDTFAAGSNSLPYLYYMIDRVKQFQFGFTISQLKAMGAKARRLDEKTLTFSFTPSVLNEVFDNTPGANTAVKYDMCPWLPCKDTTQVGVWNPNTTDHQGIVWRVDQAIGPNVAYTIERRIEIEFKKPAILTQPLSEGDVPVELPIDPPEVSL